MHNQAPFTRLNSFKQICWWILMCEDNRNILFFPQQEALWIKVPIMYLFLTNTQLSLHRK